MELMELDMGKSGNKQYPMRLLGKWEKNKGNDDRSYM